MQDLKTGLFLVDNDQTRRVLPQTSADIVEMPSASGEASTVQAEINVIRNGKLNTPAVGGTAGQVLSLDESGNTVWKADEKGDTLPSISSATAGQVLKVNSAVNGTEWGDVPKELPEQLGASGQVLAVNSAASGVEWISPTFYTKKITRKTFSSDKWIPITNTPHYYILLNIAAVRTEESDEIISVEVVSNNFDQRIISAVATIANNEEMYLTALVNGPKPNGDTTFDFIFLIKR